MSDSKLLTTTWSTRSWSTIQILKFGGLTLPGIGGTAPYLDLNDGVNWFTEQYEPSGDHVNLSREQLTWQSQGVWTGTDFTGGRTITLSSLYDETNTPLSRALASLAMAGEQYLTFDNAFGIRCKYSGFSDHGIENAEPPYIRRVKLTFTTRDPWAEDLNGLTTTTPISFNSDTAGSVAHDTSVTYDGSVFSKPILNVTVAGQVQAVTCVNVQENVSVGVYQTPLAGPGTTHLAFNSGTFRITQTEGNLDLPPAGTFPMIYPGTQTFRFYVKATTTTACTASVSYLRRFEIH